MGARRCCVGNCSSTNRTHRLYRFPKNHHLSLLWLSFLTPTTIDLSGLSTDQLGHKYVCQKHFDRLQFDYRGNRLRHGYPSLFSDKEIFYGIPLPTDGKKIFAPRISSL